MERIVEKFELYHGFSGKPATVDFLQAIYFAKCVHNGS